MSKTIAIGLGIVCIILLVGLVGAILVYSSMIDDKDSRIYDLSQQITSLSSQVTDLTSIANLTKSITWAYSENVSIQAGYESGWSFISNYAGYVSVQVFSSTTDELYVRVTYSSHGVNYDNQINVGMGGIAFFPVLPALIGISVGNPSMIAVNAIVMIVYYY